MTIFGSSRKQLVFKNQFWKEGFNMTNISISDYLANFESGMYDSPDVRVQCEAGWYDWFCRDSSLKNKTVNLTKKLLRIVNSSKIDKQNMYVFFKNNCPLDGSLYDDFRICDMKTGDVIFTVIPSSGHNSNRGIAEVWGKENGFDGPIVSGTWKDVKNYFLN